MRDLRLNLGEEARDVLMPMHLRLGADGHILHAGPTLEKLRPGVRLAGRSLFEVFEVRRPHGVVDMAGLGLSGSGKLQLQFRDAPRTDFKGVRVAEGEGVLINLSFGISLLDAIRDYDLSSSDFAPTDLAIEMLYLIEAKTTILDEWRRLNTRLESARTEAEEQAFTDTLTGLRNRRALDHVLARLCAARQQFGLVHLDLDFFKQVNDTLGHAAGDHVLQVTAEAIVKITRSEDTLVRAGGDEFVLILPGLVNRAKLVDLAQRLIRRLEEPIPFESQSCRISGSAGITVSLGGASLTPDALLIQADRALYASKNAGRGRVTVFSPELPALNTA